MFSKAINIELCSIGKEQIVHLPICILLTGTIRSLGCLESIRMNLLKGKIAIYKKDFTLIFGHNFINTLNCFRAKRAFVITKLNDSNYSPICPYSRIIIDRDIVNNRRIRRCLSSII